MGFNIGRFFSGAFQGGAAGGAVGGPFGAIGGAILGGVAGGLSDDPEPEAANAATIGRTTQVGPVTSASFAPQQQRQRPAFTATSIAPTPFLGGLGRALGRGAPILPSFAARNGRNGNQIQQILARARAATGGPVTRNKIIDAAKVCGLETAASTFGLSVNDVCLVVVKGRTRRRRGVSAADIRRTKRTIGFASRIRKDLKALAR